MLTENRTDATSFYRGAGIARDLERQSGVDIDLFDWSQVNLNWSFFIKYDLVYMQRPQGSNAVDAAEYIKKMKINLWVDFDDNYLNIPTYHFFVLQLQAGREGIINLLKLADVVTVSTHALAETYSEHNKNVVVVPNAIPEKMLGKKEYAPSDFVLWRGSHLHFPNLIGYADELQHVIDNGANIKFMGINPFFLRSYSMLPEMDIYNYFEHIKNIGAKFMFVVLQDNDFNRGRSNIAWMEGTMAGTVCLAPEWPEWERPGIITYTSKKEFIELFLAMNNGDIDLQRAYNDSFTFISENLTLEKVNTERVKIIKNL